MPFAASRGVRLPRAVVGWIGLGLVLASGLVTDTTPFPGIAALLPTTGAALVILAGLRVPHKREGTRKASFRTQPACSRWRPCATSGGSPTPCYLWHWPVLVLPIAAYGALGGPLRLALIGVSVGLAALSHRFVEEPIRHGRLVGLHPPRVLASAAALTAVVVVSAGLLSSRSAAALQPGGPPVGGDVDEVALPSTAVSLRSGAALPPLVLGPVPRDLLPLGTARDDVSIIYADGCHADLGETAPASGCAYGDPASSTVVALFGDSHAAHWFPAMERLAQERHWRLLSLTKSACASADVPVWSTIFDRPYAECTAWRQAVFELLANVHPAIVVLANDRTYQLAIEGAMASSADHEDVWSRGLATSIGRLRELGHDVVVIGDTVRQSDDPLDCLSRHITDASICSTPYAMAVAPRGLRRRRAWPGLPVPPSSIRRHGCASRTRARRSSAASWFIGTRTT